MVAKDSSVAPGRWEQRLAVALFVVCALASFWGMTRGFGEKALRGVEFRQTQTALTAYWVQQERNFSPAYPTPVLGRPWSVPMEFPLYQWTTVVVSDLTQWSLTKAGRAVSIACFWLTLPAVFLLLRRWGLAPTWRWPVLALVVTLPFHIFYARGFLIETMALMFSIWFWVAFERTVAERSRWWLVVAILAGSGAGLAKVTTYLLYLLPAAIWAASRLWQERRGRWRQDFLWMAASVAVPFAVTWGWVHYADVVKARNPLAHFLLSDELTYFNFGDLAMRLAGDVWRDQAETVTQRVAWVPAMVLSVVALVASGGRRLKVVVACLLVFAAAPFVFPLLYALHEYYFAANALMLSLAMGFAVAGWLESGRWRVGAWLLAAGLPGLQFLGYADRYLPTQVEQAPDGNGMTNALRNVTQPGEVLVVLGQDWNSMTPYYARRKALMFREGVARDPEAVTAALERLEGETIGALVIQGEPDGEQWLIDECSRHGTTPRPVFTWGDCRVFLREERKQEEVTRLLQEAYKDVALVPELVPDISHLKNRWIDFASLRVWERRAFHAMHPAPVRFFSQFGPTTDERGGWPRFSVHPVTRLAFQLPAGEHRLRMLVQLPFDAYRDDLEPGAKTDGVEISLHALGPNGSRVLLHQRLFDPVNRPEDRGNNRTVEIPFVLEYPGEVELSFEPGPSGRDTRDWMQLGPLRID